ncbi:MAG: hypothetical protein KDC58_00780 [Cyclobacteriaceae bacterium]|nr:hypothetical protein [Cyclobacteriaceae bacterium]
MDSSEYLAFVPLLIYGIALADLFGEWKRLFDKTQWFLPYILLTVVFTEVAVYNVFIYLKLVNQMADLNYINYLVTLLPPFLFMLLVNSFTPDKGDITKDYFLKNMPIFMGLLAAFIASHFLFNFEENPLTIVGRVASIVFIIITGLSRKIWMVYLASFFWLVLLLTRIDQIVI